MMKILMTVVLLLGIALTFRSCSVWNGCGYDCSIFPAGFPLQIASIVGVILGIAFFALLIGLALSALLGNEAD